MISLDQANIIITAALDHGRTANFKPLTVVVLDAGGHAIALQRADGASTLRPEIATGKAASALALGVSSRAIGVMAADRPTFVAALAALAPKGIVPAAGGVIVVDAAGITIGAVGVTGDTSDNDEAAALAGITAARLKAQG
ncbi:heme-binding protein [Sphingomonas sp. BIUV-7]|uniref:Heme-binding protein n=1 Tax=Sphingomonas natans TaxID=3063330 RepID=A0ABT8Y8Q2_9SPHN|nr:heme-binding protein [Sphingomonas sp. BIUV-7]MDO6414712.1 heme-binding protein [Sphingomonas sp. BIUV-7]